MHKSVLIFVGLSLAAPTPSRTQDRDVTSDLFGRGLVNPLINNKANMGNAQSDGGNSQLSIGDIIGGLGGTIGGAVGGVELQQLNAKPTSTPNSVSDALNQLSTQIVPNGTLGPTSLTDYTAKGFIPPGPVDLMTTVIKAGQVTNPNNRDPAMPVFPMKSPGDAPYSIPEAQLRAAINIPQSFTFGGKQPVILVPGTGSTGDLTFQGNFMKVLANKPFADPVTLNIPNFLLDDAQTNAEYVAYAMNYMSAVSKNQNVSVVAWSQGNLDTQWALKYWPSTRTVTSDLIAISPDFKGTVFSNATQLSGIIGGTAPSLFQQAPDSNFIRTLRSNGGDSAYVPTTTVYSATDEIVIPQDGPGASAIIGDARGVGVTNVQIQQACAGQPAGMQYLHEGVLFNPMAMALAMDALQNPGPGQMSRIDKNAVCAKQIGDGLDTPDVLSTSGNIPVAVVAFFMQQDNQSVSDEPPIKAYAAGGAPATPSNATVVARPN